MKEVTCHVWEKKVEKLLDGYYTQQLRATECTSKSVVYKGNGQGKDQGWWYFHISPWEEIVNRGNFLHNCNNFFMFLRTTSEEPSILSYCPCTTANKLPHNSGNIYERRGIMESYCLLQRYFHKIHSVIVDTNFQTWAHLLTRLLKRRNNN